MQGQKWVNVTELPFNNKEYSTCHPTLSADGNILYFASNRPGGLGGMDLYSSDFEGGKWGEPVNLGNKMNTAGNEIFPFIHEDGTLYFAGDGWGGFGGLDIFSTLQQADKKEVVANKRAQDILKKSKDREGILVDTFKFELIFFGF